MKLIYIATSVIPSRKANSYQVMKMCEAFALNKIDVELLIPVRFGGVRDKSDPFDYYGVRKNFKIRKIFSIDLIPLEKIIGHVGFWIQNASFTIFLSFYLLFMRADLLKGEATVIYTRDKFTLFFLALFGKKNLVWEAHSFPKKFSWVYKFILKRLRKLIVISNGLKNEFMNNIEGEQALRLGFFDSAQNRSGRALAHLQDGQIFVAPDAVDLQEFEISETKEECRKKLDLPLDKKIILYTGHLFGWKGVYTLADASEYLKDDTIVAVVGGMAEDLNNYRNYLIENKLSRVKTLGFREHKEIPYFLKAADVLVLPNSAREKISATYTSPLKLFEYMVSGRPIVASDLASLREILSDDEAIFVEPDEARSLAGGICETLKNRDLCAKIIKNCRELIKNFTWRKRAARILDFIKEKK